MDKTVLEGALETSSHLKLSSCRSPHVIVSTQVILERCVVLQPGPLQVKCLNCGGLVGYPIDHKKWLCCSSKKGVCHLPLLG